MKLTWLGHAGIRLDLDGAVVVIDPFITGAGRSADELKRWTEGCTHLLLTHGHDDHIGDTAAICQASGAPLISSFEVCMYLSGQGVKTINPGNPGGTLDLGAFTVSFTQAFHSSSTMKDGVPVYLGNPMGLVITPKGGSPTVYHMGDTDVFGDMALIQELYEPHIGIVPIGDRFTMGARNAALACRRFFRFDRIVPVHWGTFPLLAQSPQPFVDAMGDQGASVTVLGVGEGFEA